MDVFAPKFCSLIKKNFSENFGLNFLMCERSLTYKIMLHNVNYKISNSPNADSIKSHPGQLRSIPRVHEREREALTAEHVLILIQYSHSITYLSPIPTSRISINPYYIQHRSIPSNHQLHHHDVVTILQVYWLFYLICGKNCVLQFITQFYGKLHKLIKLLNEGYLILLSNQPL